MPGTCTFVEFVPSNVGNSTPFPNEHRGDGVVHAKAARSVGVTLGLMLGSVVIGDDISDGISLWRIVGWG